MSFSGFNKKLCPSLMVIILASIQVQVSYAIEFDSSILETLGFGNVDLSAFDGDSDQFTGEYSATININQQPILYNEAVHFYMKDGISQVCFTNDLINKLPIKDSVIRQLKKENSDVTDVGECLLLESLDSAIVVSFDDTAQELNLIVPQLFLDSYDPSWVSPRQRDHGISGLVLDYSLLSVYSRMKDSRGGYDSDSDFRSYGTVGANIGRFRIRADYQYSSKDNTNSDKLEWTQIYGFTDISSLNSKLYAGELYSRSNHFDGVRFKGISLFSDESMMPSYLSGYAPQVTGTANSNAVVTISQYGNILRTVQVPAGPFAITDLPTYVTGTVQIEVEEDNGNTQSYQMDIAHVPFLTRKGSIRYNANIGKLSPFEDTYVDTHFFSLDGSYGLTNHISLLGGVLSTTDREYQALNLGLGLNLESFGAISFDVTQSKNKSQENVTLTGNSYRINYAKRFGENSSLNLAGYRFSSREYTTLNNYITMKSKNYSGVDLEKRRFMLSFTQFVPAIDTSITASLTKGSYWNRGNMASYNITASKVIQSGIFTNASMSVSLMKNQDDHGIKEKQVSFFMSIPLNTNHSSRVQYSANYNDRTERTDQQLTYYDDVLGGHASIGMKTYQKRDFSGSVDYSLNASYYAETRYGRVTTTADYNDGNQHVTAGFDGSITITQHGIATHPRVYNEGARLIIDAGSSGVKVTNNHATSNIFGLAGVSNIPSYYRTTYVIDNDNLPEDVEIQDSVLNIAVSDGAIAYKSAGGISGVKALAIVSLADGTHPPFGASVYRDRGLTEEVAMVADQGFTYLSGLDKNSEFIVKWGGDQSCRLVSKTLDQDDLRNLTCYME